LRQKAPPIDSDLVASRHCQIPEDFKLIRLLRFDAEYGDQVETSNFASDSSWSDNVSLKNFPVGEK
jgi:hypothetical protein